jgi:hypothetical protein
MEGKNVRGNNANNTRKQETKHEKAKRSNYLGVLDDSCSALDCHFFLGTLHVLVDMPQAPSIAFRLTNNHFLHTCVLSLGDFWKLKVK